MRLFVVYEVFFFFALQFFFQFIYLGIDNLMFYLNWQDLLYPNIERIFIFSKLKLSEKVCNTAANHFTSNGQYLYIWNKQLYADRQKERDWG